MKKLFKIIAYFLSSIIVFIILYFLAANILSRIVIQKEKDFSKDLAIYISTNGMHTDLILPVKTETIDWSKEIKYTDTKGKDNIQKYIALGWGDKGFYLDVPDWDHVKPSIAFKAAFGLSTTAIHATYLKEVVEDKDCKKIMISKEQYNKLVEFIKNDFQLDGNGHIINIKTEKTYGSNDAFYEATGTYQMFYTCNTWANTALKKSGLKSCLWTPFQEGIFRLYK
ncbi:TIGR02117 family protein [Apibacter muscae]|uniref:TIGR02117 family protein n=1 Tax=Apibacter muscae TaxID=2509004 RepID=UPI0011AB8FE4|nr:TIGR02117 family protein [Apibacter muscae]TWP30413.1 TIGR02117 family protein [Apibacter muscae]